MFQQKLKEINDNQFQNKLDNLEKNEYIEYDEKLNQLLETSKNNENFKRQFEKIEKEPIFKPIIAKIKNKEYSQEKNIDILSSSAFCLFENCNNSKEKQMNEITTSSFCNINQKFQNKEEAKIYLKNLYKSSEPILIFNIHTKAISTLPYVGTIIFKFSDYPNCTNPQEKTATIEFFFSSDFYSNSNFKDSNFDKEALTFLLNIICDAKDVFELKYEKTNEQKVKNDSTQKLINNIFENICKNRLDLNYTIDKYELENNKIYFTTILYKHIKK